MVSVLPQISSWLFLFQVLRDSSRSSSLNGYHRQQVFSSLVRSRYLSCFILYFSPCEVFWVFFFHSRFNWSFAEALMKASLQGSYSDWSQQYCGLDGLHSFHSFQILSSFISFLVDFLSAPTTIDVTVNLLFHNIFVP